MPTAFVLIGVEAGSEQGVIDHLRALNNVKDVYPVYGVYDIVAKIQANSERELKETITYRLRGLAKIKSTQTLMISE
ncbi:MAG: Lrp/AsnC ligand binding domain-containing protein [archaeon]|jgi:DNA-binding Lrp family transcriptional regulator|nr:Lrp/AsnC ligand binding domain-containing protein [archaeon]